MPSSGKRGAFNVADKARTWLKQIFSQAIARGLCEHNPASELQLTIREVDEEANEALSFTPALKVFYILTGGAVDLVT